MKCRLKNNRFSHKGENVSLRHKLFYIYKAVIFIQHISKEDCFPKWLFRDTQFFNVPSEPYKEFDAHFFLRGLSFSPKYIGTFWELHVCKYGCLGEMLEKGLAWLGQATEFVIRVQSQPCLAPGPASTPSPYHPWVSASSLQNEDNAIYT